MAAFHFQFQFQPRKLLNDSIEDEFVKTCKSYCNPQVNTDGGCPIPCLSLCFPICNHLPFDEMPPPVPDLDALSDNSHHRGGISIFLSISLAILATVFFVFCCYSVYRFYKGRSSSRSRELSSPQPPSRRRPPEEEAHLEFLDEDRGPVVDHPIWYIRTVGLQPSVISAITICKYKRGDGLVEGTECSVCLSEFQEDETLRLLPKCNHAFHIPCIDTWLASHTNCPNCRAGIVTSTPSFRPVAPSLQNSALNSGRLEESQAAAEESVESEREIRVLEEVSIDIEDEMESRANSREREGIQPVRRSVSLDSVSASVISAGIANVINKDKILVESAPKGAAGDDDQSSSSSSSTMEIGSLQKETSSSSSVKRSLSCSAKVFLSRYSRSRNAGI